MQVCKAAQLFDMLLLQTNPIAMLCDVLMNMYILIEAVVLNLISSYDVCVLQERLEVKMYQPDGVIYTDRC